MSAWPLTLPTPYTPYELSSGDGTVRTDMDAGPARVRRRYTSAPDMISLSFVLNESQMAAFRAFWDSDFLGGAAWVFMPIKTGRTAGIVSKECRPTSGSFKAVPVSATDWTVSFDVEVRRA